MKKFAFQSGMSSAIQYPYLNKYNNRTILRILYAAII